MAKMQTVTRTPLASNWNARIQEGYDVIIIGSGYGGSITAARLATANWGNGAKPTVCILERGKEWLPGQFPDDLNRGAAALRSDTNPLGLHEIRFGLDMAIWQGSGLGGTSLINANVAIEPDSETFDDPQWPQAIRGFRDSGELQQRFDRVRATLAAGKHPDGASLNKVKALQLGQQGVPGADFDLAQIVVNFTANGKNGWGVTQQPCINCGDCVTGCNAGAKNTLDTNYLAIANSGGAHLFPQVEVEHIEKDEQGGYLVYCIRREENPPQSEGAILKAKRAVVVSAGSPGSPTVLLRSRAKGLSLPDTLGTRFSGNGDFFGVAYNSDVRMDVLGWGAYPDSDRAARIKPGPGPTIVSRIKYNTNQPPGKRITIEDLAFPLTYVDAARGTFAFLIGKDTDAGDFFQESGRRLRDMFAIDPALEKGALNYTMLYLVVGHDNAGGRIELDGATRQAVIRWPKVGEQETFQIADELMLGHATKLGATYIQNPSWAFTPFRTLITVHPLGGCPMGETHATGVVNDRGQVFDENGALHDGLYVTDGSIVPVSLGVNPFLTISALSERVAEGLIQRLGGTPAVVTPAG
ncbi:MAG: GMC family oxidoreductase [Bryobacterales bacterium]|nr:GMC family oxidoreductase [Bryobacterales bacterium]